MERNTGWKKPLERNDVNFYDKAFSKSKGIYGGISLEGSVVGVRDSLNKAHYGKEISPVQIIVEQKASNKGSSKLRAILKMAGK
jgi:SH3 domain-containing YSC84-like protein 1